MNEGKSLIEQMQDEKGIAHWSQNDLADYIRKSFSIDIYGNITLSEGIYLISELEAIIICAAMERATFRG